MAFALIETLIILKTCKIHRKNVNREQIFCYLLCHRFASAQQMSKKIKKTLHSLNAFGKYVILVNHDSNKTKQEQPCLFVLPLCLEHYHTNF